MIFLRACTALRLRFTEGFSKCCRFRSSVKIPDFSTFRLKRRRAFSKLSSSRTCTTGIHLTSLLFGTGQLTLGAFRLVPLMCLIRGLQVKGRRVVHPEGVEPPTYRSVVCCSIQLS